LLLALERILELFALLKSFFILQNQYKIREGVMCAEHITHLVQTRNIYQILAGSPEGKRRCGRHRHRWEDNIKTS
jgi:hypothetical protein